MRRLIAIALLACCVAQPLLGQTGASIARLAPGARVRVTLPHEEPRAASVVTRTADTLVVRWADLAGMARLPFGQMTGLEVSNGRHRSLAKGAGWGAAIGAGAGAILGALTYSPCDGFDCIVTPSSRSEATAYGAAGGGVLGLVIGGLVGLKPHEEWERVSIAPRIASSRSVDAGFSISLAF